MHEENSEKSHNHSIQDIEEEIVVISDQGSPIVQRQRRAEMDGVNYQMVELVKPRYLDDDEQRRKQSKIDNAVEMMREIEATEKEKQEVMRDVLRKKKNKQMERQLEKQLRKQFEMHAYLPVTSLAGVKKILQRFDTLCRIEKLSSEENMFAKTKQQNRRLLTRALLLTVQELRERIRRDQLNDQEKDLVDGAINTIPFCYEIASDIEREFFGRLARRPGRSEQYQRQIKLVLREFNDKNNVEFRRSVIGKRVDLKMLSKVTEQELKCGKTKEEELVKMQQLIRESEKDPFGAKEPEVEEDLFRNPQMGSFPSAMDVEVPRESAEEVKKRESKELTQVCLQRYQKCEELMNGYVRMRNERVQELKKDHQHNAFFVGLCQNMGI